MTEKRSLALVGSNSPRLEIEDLAIKEVKRNANSPRIHPKKQIAMLMRNIDVFGFLVPCTVDEDNRLLGGNARVEAADRLGMKTIPVVRVRHLTNAEKRAFVLADNKLAEGGYWDPEILRTELQFFADLNIEFDFSVLGFEDPEIDIILDADDDSRADEIPPASGPTQRAISVAGDLWNLGGHRVLCGNALDVSAYSTVLGSNRARAAIADPPYNVRIDGHARVAGSKHREFAMASGEMSSDDYRNFLAQAVHQMSAFCVDGSLHYIFIDWRHVGELQAAGKTAYTELKNICVWNKTNGGMGSFYRSQHELVLVFKAGTAPHINNINLGVHGRNRTNVWTYPGVNAFSVDRDTNLRLHPTVKPVAMVADIMKDCSKRGDLILDPFGGSGTTIIAAEKTDRRAAVIEIDPLYVDVIIRRWERYSGNKALCARTGETFADREARSADKSECNLSRGQLS